MATPLAMLNSPNVGKFASFGVRYNRDRMGNYRDRYGRSPIQNWRQLFFSRTGRYPTNREETAWHLRNVPGSRYGLAQGQLSEYGVAEPPPGRPSVPGAQPARSGTSALLPPPTGQQFGPPRLAPNVMATLRGLTQPRVAQPSSAAPVTQAPAAQLPDFWGIVNSAPSYDARGVSPARPTRTGVQEF